MEGYSPSQGSNRFQLVSTHCDVEFLVGRTRESDSEIFRRRNGAWRWHATTHDTGHHNLGGQFIWRCVQVCYILAQPSPNFGLQVCTFFSNKVTLRQTGCNVLEICHPIKPELGKIRNAHVHRSAGLSMKKNDTPWTRNIQYLVMAKSFLHPDLSSSNGYVSNGKILICCLGTSFGASHWVSAISLLQPLKCGTRTRLNHKTDENDCPCPAKQKPKHPNPKKKNTVFKMMAQSPLWRMLFRMSKMKTYVVCLK